MYIPEKQGCPNIPPGTGFCLCRLEVKVEVNLRPTVSRPVCLGVRRPSGTRDQFFFLLEISFWLLFQRTRSLGAQDRQWGRGWTQYVTEGNWNWCPETGGGTETLNIWNRTWVWDRNTEHMKQKLGVGPKHWTQETELGVGPKHWTQETETGGWDRNTEHRKQKLGVGLKHWTQET
jgi:hypothetical protein